MDERSSTLGQLKNIFAVFLKIQRESASLSTDINFAWYLCLVSRRMESHGNLYSDANANVPRITHSSRLVAWQNLALKRVSVNTVDNCRAGRKHSTFLHVEDNKGKLQSNGESTLTSTQLQITTNNVCINRV